MVEQIRQKSALDLPDVELIKTDYPESLRVFHTGDLLLRQGDFGDQLYILLKGRLDIINDLNQNRDIRLDEIGTIVGEIAGLNPNLARTRSVIAHGHVEVIELFRNDISEWNWKSGQWSRLHNFITEIAKQRIADQQRAEDLMERQRRNPKLLRRLSGEPQPLFPHGRGLFRKLSVVNTEK